MSQQRYFFKFKHSYAQKNKLYKEFCDFMYSLDGMLLESEDHRKQFLMMIKRQRDILIKKHSRCHPLEVNFFTVTKTGIYVSGSFQSELYPIKLYWQDENSELEIIKS